jgi:hypothetical protein
VNEPAASGEYLKRAMSAPGPVASFATPAIEWSLLGAQRTKKRVGHDQLRSE